MIGSNPGTLPGAETHPEQAAFRLLDSRHQSVCFAESCTGGLLCATLVCVPGASRVLEESHVTYSDAAKHRVLGVSEETLQRHTAVSAPCALEMARGARQVSGADWGVSTTGYAGPDGGEDGTPVGTVFIAMSGPGGDTVTQHRFPGSREQVRNLAVTTALEALVRRMEAR